MLKVFIATVVSFSDDLIYTYTSAVVASTAFV